MKSLISLYLLSFLLHLSSSAAIAPTWSDEEKATEEIQAYCNQLKSDVEADLKQTFCDFIAKRFIYQVPDKINYIIKVQAGADKWIHVKVSQDLPCYGGKVELDKCQYPKFEADLIKTF